MASAVATPKNCWSAGRRWKSISKQFYKGVAIVRSEYLNECVTVSDGTISLC